MKKRLLSFALFLFMLAALLPLGAAPAQAAFEPVLRFQILVDPPQKGGNIYSVPYSYTDGVIPDNDFSDSNYSYVWYDENDRVIAENESLRSLGLNKTQLIGKTFKLSVKFPVTVDTGYNVYHYWDLEKVRIYGLIQTQYKGKNVFKSIGGKYKDPDTGKYYVSASYIFDPVCFPVEKNADISVTAPVVGQSIDFSAVSDHPEQLRISDTGADWHSHGVRWFDKTEGLAVTGGTFKAGHEYEVSVYVEAANEYYYFGDESLTEVTINGDPAAVTKLSDELYEITYTFPPLCSVNGVIDGETLAASVTSPGGSVLIAVRYDGGKLDSVKLIPINEPCEEKHVDTGLSKKTGCTYRLMLADKATYAPLCEAWSGA
ncbi:MAG: hypothetical protein IJG50_02630 [Clostridia bacterium]|nr:hypothetical protein [Clostridia bacterium]